MELSPEILGGLRRISNTSLVTQENFDKLLSELSKYLEKPSVDKHSVGIPSSTPRIDVLKESYSSLITFLIECMRRKLEPEILHSILLENRIQNDRIDKILKLFSSHKSSIQNALRRFNSHPPEVYDVSWKMSYCMKSSFSDFDGKCLYFIELKISGNSQHNYGAGGKSINFVCTVQQLQSLVASLKAAVRRLESIASVSK